MKCSEICALIEQEYGTEYACDWDNVGLLAGRSTKEVKKILLSLDATDEVVRMAAEGGYDMLITHHPMLFSAIKRVTDQDMNGRRLLELIRNDISYYAMHTNYDTRGMADLATRLMGLTECAVLEEVKDGEGIGRVGKLPHPMTLRECGEQVKVAYGIPNVRLFGNPDTQVSLVGICPGAGKSTMPLALGFGFRCGFLGLLHLEIIQERLEREFDLDLVTTAPSVIYKIHKTNGEVIDLTNPSNLPDPSEIPVSTV